MNLQDLAWRIAIRHELPVRRARDAFIRGLGLLALLLAKLPGSSLRFGPPRAFTVDTFEWAGAASVPRYEIDPPSVVRRSVDAAGQPLPFVFEALQEWPIRRNFVVELEDARVWGPSAVPIASDDTLLADLELFSIQKPSELPIRHRLRLGRAQHLAGRTATLVGPFPQSYHHWILDLLPRLDLLQSAGTEFDQVLVPPMRAFHRETLERAGVSLSAVVVHEKKSYRSLDRLVLPSFPGQYGQATPRVCDYVRELFSAEIAGRQETKRLYVGRGDASRRRLRNEDEVLAMLKPLGFEEVSMAGHTVAEQAELLASAEAVVGAHGGALTNLVFCQPGTKVVELFGARYTPGCYWAIAVTLGLRYLPLFQENDAAHNGAQWTDYTVSPARVTAALRHLGIA